MVYSQPVQQSYSTGVERKEKSASAGWVCHDVQRLTAAVCGINVLDCWELTAYDPLRRFNYPL